jgi:DNA polymerase/3'-5' exonuclease PolX
MEPIKTLIIDNLTIVSKNEVAYKKKFYNQAIISLNDMTEKEILQRKKFHDIPGIGKKINDKIMEVRSSGANLAKVDGILNADKDTFDLSTLYGIGPKLKEKIEAEHGKIKDIAHLKKLDEEHRFLNDKNKLGLKYYDDMLKRIPRSEMHGHNHFIQEVISMKHFNIKYDISGSYRRESEDSGDIDILITSSGDNYIDKYKEFVDYLKSIDYIVDVLAYGDNKFMGLCKLGGSDTFRRIDIIVTKPEQYYFELLYFTGSDDFNKEMRSEALIQGYSLSQYNFTDTKTKEFVSNTFNSEKSIFDFLGYKYVIPKNRKSGVLANSKK